MKIRFPRNSGPLALLAVVLLHPSCGGSGGDGGGSGAAAFALQSTTPGAGSASQSPATWVSATFNADLDPASIASSAIDLKAGPTTIPGTVSFTNRVVTFVPDSPLTPLTVYTATLDPAVKDLSGRSLGASQVWTFTTRDWAWSSTTTTLPPPTPWEPSTFILKASPGGIIFVVWALAETTPTSNDRLYANYYTPAEGWHATVPIQAAGSANTGVPILSLDVGDSGVAMVAWQEFYGGSNAVWVNRFVPGSGWGTEQSISTNVVYGPASPCISMNASGKALLLWTEHDGAGFSSVNGSFFDPSTGWSAAAPVESDDGNAYDPKAFLADDGTALCVWHQFMTLTQDIRASTYTPLGGWTTPVLLETDDAGDAGNLHLGRDASGRFLAAWSQDDGAATHVWSNRYVPGTGWEGRKAVDANIGPFAILSDLAVNAAGEAVAIWYQNDGSLPWDACANRYDPVSGWGSPGVLDLEPTLNVGYPKAGIDAAGGVRSAWWLDSNEVWTSWAAPGSAWTTAAMEVPTSGLAPQLVVLPNGSAVMAWKAAGIQVRRFD